MSLDLDFYSFVYVMITRQQSVRSTNQNTDGLCRQPISAPENDHVTRATQQFKNIFKTASQYYSQFQFHSEDSINWFSKVK